MHFHVDVLLAAGWLAGSDNQKSTNTFPMPKYPFRRISSLMIDRGEWPATFSPVSIIIFGAIENVVRMRSASTNE